MDLVKTENINKPFQGMTTLPIVKQLGLLIGLAASIAIGFYVILWSQDSSYVQIMPGMDPSNTSKVVSILQSSAIDYKLDPSTGNVLVASSEVQKVRLKLAGEGISNNPNVGFELLEKEQGFTTSQFMQNIRYHRALEGELSRTIMSMAVVHKARIHLAIPKQSSFVRDRKNASASVFVDLVAGRSLTDEQIASIVNLVASSIPNMEVTDVSLIDNKGRLLSINDDSAGIGKNIKQLKYTQNLEKNYVRRIENILTPIVGLGNIKAQVVADIDFNRFEQTREVFDSEQPSIRSERKTNEESTGNSAAIGIPGALSNQPSDEGSAPQTTTRENSKKILAPTRKRNQSTLNYELNKTISHTRQAPARIKRLTVAVVVDNKMELVAAAVDASKPDAAVAEKILTSIPRTTEELNRITILVKDTVGYNALRGDSVNIINAPFVVPAEIEALPDIPIWKQAWVFSTVKQALGLIFVLYLIFGILRPVMNKLALHKPMTVIKEQLQENTIADDQVTLSGDSKQKLLDPAAYENDLAMAKSVVAQDPKLVAQVVKTWVSNE